MHSARTKLLAKGGLDEAVALCFYPSSEDELLALYREAFSRSRRLTLVGARKSFGGHFLAPEDADACDVTGWGGEPRTIERSPDGAELWVRVPAGVTFKQLLRKFPSYRPENPPTSDGISIGGALASCTHNMGGFFADSVRAFTLLAPNGERYQCSPHGTRSNESFTLSRLAPSARWAS